MNEVQQLWFLRVYSPFHVRTWFFVAWGLYKYKGSIHGSFHQLSWMQLMLGRPHILPRCLSESLKNIKRDRSWGEKGKLHDTWKPNAKPEKDGPNKTAQVFVLFLGRNCGDSENNTPHT